MHSPLEPSKTPPKLSSGNFSLNINYQQQTRPRLCISNCRSIEVEVYTTNTSPTPSQPTISLAQGPEIPIQPHGTEIDPTADLPSSSPDPPQPSGFPFLSLPLELRLKIYALLLPPRHHKIVTQIPSNGHYYSTNSLPPNTTQSFYPFTTRQLPNLTTYKVFTKATNYPSESTSPEILRTCKQLREEGEGVLYGGKGVELEFGGLGDHGNGEAMRAFLMDRGSGARASIRKITILRQMPVLKSPDLEFKSGVNEEWEKTCSFVTNELPGLRKLNLVICSPNKSLLANNYRQASDGQIWEGEVESEESEVEKENRRNELMEMKVREWGWIKELVGAKGLRGTETTWCGFEDGEMEEGLQGTFKSWISGRIVKEGSLFIEV